MLKKEIDQFYLDFININNYISYNDLERIKNSYSELYTKISNKLLYKIYFIRFLYDYNHIENLKLFQNKKYILNELNKSNNLLNNINGHSLDYNQRLAVVSDEYNSLVVAGAGSGKTLTIIGKIRYLIENKNIDESEILCISFTNDSVNDIKNSLNKFYNYNIDVFTFHKLALNILNDDGNYKIANDKLLYYIIDEYFKCNFPNNIILKYENHKLYSELKTLIFTFINLFKSNNFSLNCFSNFYEEINSRNKMTICKDKILLDIIKKIYILYRSELKSQNMIDFNDMVNLAIRNLNIDLGYKYIIIDEYQDTSLTRYKLVKKIRDMCKSKLIAVGDDFQSIYRFTGCDLDIFLNFELYFGKANIIKIKNTYRNSKELIGVSGNFIMKNKFQIRKMLLSDKHCFKPIKIVYYVNLVDTFEKIINTINTDIFVLGRNNRDIWPISESEKFIYENGRIVYKKDTSKVINFYTVHKSKGLESDNVIVLNVIDDYLGFPSKIVNENILDFVSLNIDKYPYEEERRLFYVALTRTKNNVYLMTKKGKESIFIKEIVKNSINNIQIIKELL